MKIPRELKVSNNMLLNILSIFMIIFIILDVNIPPNLSLLLDEMLVKSLLLIASIFLFINSPVVGAISLIFVLELFRRNMNGNSRLPNDVNRENELFHQKSIQQELSRSNHVRDRYLMSFNQFPKTLEEEVVHKMVPLVNERINNRLKYKPVMCDIHQAAKL